MEYKEYKSWIKGLNPEETPMTESDIRIKGFVTRGVNDDEVLRKMLMLGLMNDDIIDRDLGNLFIMKKFMNSYK